tara:strand:+ start:679 stop:1485 length:807 start_codon:yes stop_codon:yes gene_type:complete
MGYMKNSGNSDSHYKTIWLSDIHLGTKGCQAEKLLDFLYEYSCDKIYLVGDIIDGWRLSQNFYWPQSHSNVVRRLLSFSKKGTEIIFITGNHDEFLRSFSPLNLGNIKVLDEAVHTTEDGKEILVIHGDQYDVVTKYSRSIAVLGSVGYEMLMTFNRFWNVIRKIFGYKNYWSLSAFVKYKVKSAVNFISDFEETLALACKKKGYEGVISGHIHHAEIRKIHGIDYMNCGDWVESCTALVEKQDGVIEIIQYGELTSNNNRDIANEAA